MYLKKSTIVALYKEGKKDYSLLNAYRPIVLENTLAKVVEKTLANYILNVVKTHELLP